MSDLDAGGRAYSGILEAEGRKLVCAETAGVEENQRILGC
jgi:hypothetical protein